MAPKESRASKIVEYNDNKLWFHKRSNTVTLGITLDALDEIGDVQGINLPSEGDDFDKDDIVCEIDGDNGAIKVYSPAAGFITEINSQLAEDPKILNEDPIDEGWLLKLEMQDSSDLQEFIADADEE
ncbi:MAG: glycine cleavage system protein H [Bacteriovoracia bacterium]